PAGERQRDRRRARARRHDAHPTHPDPQVPAPHQEDHMTTITDPLSAASVGAVVRRAGYPTGYRYAQTGYTHRGQPITETGCEVTRVAGNARRGLYDAGEVRVFVIQPRDLTTYEQRDLAVEKIAAALAEAFPGREVVKTADMVSVS